MINKEGIDELAERVVAKYSTCFPICPLEIADKINVKVVAESYGNHFNGFICYNGSEFHIILNLDQIRDINYASSRYTFSHELGHYFIGAHRKRLKQGESFAFLGKNIKHPEKKTIENEAQHFAAALLMPRTQFINYFNELTTEGFEAIIDLKSYFNVSVTSAAIRFVNLNLTPCITILWKEEGIINKGVSEKFLILVNKRSIEVKLNPDRPKFEEVIIFHDSSGIEYTKSITPLSSWTYNLSKDFSNQFFLIEETFSFSKANLTILHPVNK